MTYQPTDDAVAGLPLAGARAELLEEIMSTPVVESPPSPAPESRTNRWLVPLAAAAAVATVVTVPTWLLAGSGETRQTPDAGSSSSAGPEEARPEEALAEEPFPEEARQKARSSGDLRSSSSLSANTWLVLGAPGWTVDYVSVSEWGRGVNYVLGGQQLHVDLRDAATRRSYVEDRQGIGSSEVDPGTSVELAGNPALMWAYSRRDHTAIGPVVGEVYAEVRGSGMDEEAYERLLAELTWTDRAGFEASLPESFVTRAEVSDAIADMVVDIPLPPGAQAPVSDESDPYQLGAEVARQVVCGWIEEFGRASEAGDEEAARAAQDVLGSAREWGFLRAMDGQGGYPTVLWGITDQVASGRVPAEYVESLGC